MSLATTTPAPTPEDRDAGPPLRLRALPCPHPAPWEPPSPAPGSPHARTRHLAPVIDSGPAVPPSAARHGRRGTPRRPGGHDGVPLVDVGPVATGQQAFVLHGLPGTVADDRAEDPSGAGATGAEAGRGRDDLPCPDQLARRLVQAAVDVVRGHRPAGQLLRWTTPEVYSALRQRARLEQLAGTPGGRRPVVRSLRTSPCGERGVEVSAVVLDGPRARAVAARLDGEDSRWRLTALVIG